MVDRGGTVTVPTPEQCGTSTGAIQLGDQPPFRIGPCVLPRDHDGSVHRAADGVEWTGDVGASPEQCGEPGVAGPCILPPDHAESLHEGPDGKCWLAEVASPSLLQGSPTAGSNSPADGLRDRLTAALVCEHYRRARERLEASPEEHCTGFADAVLPIVEAAIARAELRYKGLAEGLQIELRAAIAAWGQAERERDDARDLLREFVSDIPCHLHPGNGFCQTHFERKPCPHAAAKKLLGIDPKETP